MATIKQIEANRLNSQKSTGPRSVEGKARSSQNALKSGLDAESLIILGEDREALETLTQEYMERFHPTTPEQRHFIDILIRDDWQLRRLAKVDTQIWERELISPLKYDQNAPLGSAYACGSTTFSRLQRRMDSVERSYQRALRELQAIEVAQASACEVGPAFSLRLCRLARYGSFRSASNQDFHHPLQPVEHRSPTCLRPKLASFLTNPQSQSPPLPHPPGT